MDIQDSSAAIYSEAKSEYTKQLVFNFQPVLLRFFLDRFTEVKQAPSVTSRAKSALSEFQDSLSQIPEWNLDKVRTESTALLQAIQCDYIEELITAVFIAHTKILSAIRLHSKPRRKINITVPKPDHFMHRTMSECSRLLWSNVYLFSDSVPSLDRQKNMNEVNRFLEEGILQAIRNLLPVKSILRDSLQEDEDDGIQVETKTVEEPKLSDAADAPDAAEASDALEANEFPLEASDIPEVPEVPEAPRAPEVQKQETLVIDTERSVGFTGVDSVFGTTGEAELRESNEDGDELKILGDLEELDMGEIEDLNAPVVTPIPLSADDYESL
jgi:SHS2 domain-containing protein